MSAERWIIIRNWERFQHADMMRSVVPPWIKNYTRLMSDDNYLALTEHQALILHRLWLTYASARCHLLLNTSSLSRHLHVRVMTRDLEALNHAGFIEFSASKPASRSRVRREVEEEEEIKPLAFKGVENRGERQEDSKISEEQELGEEEPLEDRSADLAELMQGLADNMGDPWKDWR